MTDMDQARADEPRCQVPSCPDFGDPDFGEATCPSWHADEPSSPVDAVGPSGPVGRSVGEIRADLARCDRDGVPWPAAARRLLADVPSLLAEVEAAHRFEQSAAAEREALLAEVEPLRERDLSVRRERKKRERTAYKNDRLERARRDAEAERDSLRGVVQAVEALAVEYEAHAGMFDASMDTEAHRVADEVLVRAAKRLRAALAAAADAPEPKEKR